MVELCSLFSGSSGNASFVKAGNTNILVDCGESGAHMEEALKKIGVAPDALDCIFITHEHTDHIKGAGILSRRYNLPIYATVGTWQSMISKIGKVASDNIRYIKGGVPFGAFDAIVTPFETPHDSCESVGFTIEHNGRKASVATDIGVMNKTVYENIKHSDIVLLESNHDVDMLLKGPYSPELKRRVRSSLGHLSNDDCALTCAHLLEQGVKHILLGHLSLDNNTPSVAYNATEEALVMKGARIGHDITLEVASRYTPSAKYTVR
ncbi:MAG: MBL fold metallo-hydrolase [Clostridia bacterium]|nr:MBL fold metallo-hydrolase [Clostridia bacterium]